MGLFWWRKKKPPFAPTDVRATEGKEDKSKEEQKAADVKDVKAREPDSPSGEAVRGEKKDEKKVRMKDLYDESGEAKKDPGLAESAGEAGEPKKKGEKKEAKTVARKGMGKDAHKVLIKPLVSEKAAGMGAENKYVFVVSARANKIMVKKAIEQAYGVKPVMVNIINNKGKQVKTGRIEGKRKDWKKAVVTLPKGRSIQIYEGV